MILILISTAGAAPFAYITNTGSNNVSVIDTATNNVTATVNVGDHPSGVAISLNGAMVYVANVYDGNVSVIDTITNTVTSNVSVGNVPIGITITPDGKKLYVASLYDHVSVIDTATNNIIATVPVAPNCYPHGIAVTPDGTKVYVANTNTNNITVINTTTNNIAATVNGGMGLPLGFAVAPNKTTIYVACNLGRNVVAINTITDTVDWSATSTMIPDEYYPNGIAITPDGKKLYVTASNATEYGAVYVIDTINNTFIATVPVGSIPQGVSVTPDGTKVYVVNTNDNNVSVINTTTNTVTSTVPVGNGPTAFGQFIGPMRTAPTITWSNPADIIYGTPLNDTQLDATALDPISRNPVDGTFIYTPSLGTVLNAGQNQKLTVTFTPTGNDAVNYTASKDTVYINVITAVPSLKLSKIANLASYDHVGQVIGYNYTINNTGNVNLTGLTITDNLTTVESHVPIMFQPGQNFTGTATYTITQSDYDIGSVTNLAKTTGFFDNTQYATTNTTTITATGQNPALNLTKIPNLFTYTNGQAVTYTYKVTNIGNITLSSVSVNDTTLRQPIILGTTTLAPGASTTGTYTYTTTQTDYDNGLVVDDALATGTFNSTIY